MSFIYQPFSITTSVSQYQNASILAFLGAKDEDGGLVVVTTGAVTCNAIVISSSPTNQHPNFLQAGCPSCHPTNSVRALKGESITLHGLAHPKLTWESNLALTTKGSWLPWGGLPSLMSALS